MCHGDLVRFIEKYYTGLDFCHMEKLRRYFATYEENMGKQDDFFKSFITEWCKEVGFIE